MVPKMSVNKTVLNMLLSVIIIKLLIIGALTGSIGLLLIHMCGAETGIPCKEGAYLGAIIAVVVSTISIAGSGAISVYFYRKQHKPCDECQKQSKRLDNIDSNIAEILKKLRGQKA